MKKLKVFISSVQKEFAAERQTLFHHLHNDPFLKLFFEPFIFENTPAADHKVDTAYINEVLKSDIYIGLFGTDYGYEDSEGISPTEREFDEATKQHKTHLIYVKGDSSLSRHPKMTKLINKVGLDVIRKHYHTEAELSTSISASLANYLMEKEIIRSGTFDAAPCTDNFDVIDEITVRNFVTKARYVRNFPLSPTASINEILIHLNLLTHNNKLTNAAIPLFGKSPQRFILSSEVKCAHFHGKEVAKPIPSYQVYKGDVFELVDQSVDFILSKIDFEVGTREQSNQVPTKYEIPRAVVSEAIVNAIAHRDYSSNGSVQVMLFSDRLEVWNPGTLPSSLTLEQLKGPHGSVPFNPLVAEPMYLTGYIERFGSGTRDMIRLSHEAGLKEPEFSLTDGFKVVVWRPAKDDYISINEDITSVVSGGVTGGVTGRVTGRVTRETSEEIKRIVLVVKGEMKKFEIQKNLDLSSDDFFRVNYILPALESGYIEMTYPQTPNHPNQQYKLTAKGKSLKKRLKTQKRP